jgi:hypothetical protein
MKTESGRKGTELHRVRHGPVSKELCHGKSTPVVVLRFKRFFKALSLNYQTGS